MRSSTAIISQNPDSSLEQMHYRDLLQGTGEWRNIQEIIQTGFQCVVQILQAQNGQLLQVQNMETCLRRRLDKQLAGSTNGLFRPEENVRGQLSLLNSSNSMMQEESAELSRKIRTLKDEQEMLHSELQQIKQEMASKPTTNDLNSFLARKADKTDVGANWFGSIENLFRSLELRLDSLEQKFPIGHLQQMSNTTPQMVATSHNVARRLDLLHSEMHKLSTVMQGKADFDTIITALKKKADKADNVKLTEFVKLQNEVNQELATKISQDQYQGDLDHLSNTISILQDSFHEFVNSMLGVNQGNQAEMQYTQPPRVPLTGGNQVPWQQLPQQYPPQTAQYVYGPGKSGPPKQIPMVPTQPTTQPMSHPGALRPPVSAAPENGPQASLPDSAGERPGRISFPQMAEQPKRVFAGVRSGTPSPSASRRHSFNDKVDDSWGPEGTKTTSGADTEGWPVYTTTETENDELHKDRSRANKESNDQLKLIRERARSRSHSTGERHTHPAVTVKETRSSRSSKKNIFEEETRSHKSSRSHRSTKKEPETEVTTRGRRLSRKDLLDSARSPSSQSRLARAQSSKSLRRRGSQVDDSRSRSPSVSRRTDAEREVRERELRGLSASRHSMTPRSMGSRSRSRSESFSGRPPRSPHHSVSPSLARTFPASSKDPAHNSSHRGWAALKEHVRSMSRERKAKERQADTHKDEPQSHRSPRLKESTRSRQSLSSSPQQGGTIKTKDRVKQIYRLSDDSVMDVLEVLQRQVRSASEDLDGFEPVKTDAERLPRRRSSSALSCRHSRSVDPDTRSHLSRSRTDSKSSPSPRRTDPETRSHRSHKRTDPETRSHRSHRRADPETRSHRSHKRSNGDEDRRNKEGGGKGWALLREKVRSMSRERRRGREDSKVLMRSSLDHSDRRLSHSADPEKRSHRSHSHTDPQIKYHRSRSRTNSIERDTTHKGGSRGWAILREKVRSMSREKRKERKDGTAHHSDTRMSHRHSDATHGKSHRSMHRHHSADEEKRRRHRSPTHTQDNVLSRHRDATHGNSHRSMHRHHSADEEKRRRHRSPTHTQDKVLSRSKHSPSEIVSTSSRAHHSRRVEDEAHHHRSRRESALSQHSLVPQREALDEGSSLTKHSKRLHRSRSHSPTRHRSSRRESALSQHSLAQRREALESSSLTKDSKRLHRSRSNSPTRHRSSRKFGRRESALSQHSLAQGREALEESSSLTKDSKRLHRSRSNSPARHRSPRLLKRESREHSYQSAYPLTVGNLELHRKTSEG